MTNAISKNSSRILKFNREVALVIIYKIRFSYELN